MSIPVPEKTIACQELVGRNTSRIQGHLRRRTKVDEFVGKIIQNFKWTRNYVVVNNGCVYCYNDETSLIPARAVSLYGFNDCSECSMGEMPYTIPWVFKLHNALNENKSIYLAAASREDMKKWLKILKEQITKFNSIIIKSPTKQNDSDSESEQNYIVQYDEVEKETQYEETSRNSFPRKPSEGQPITPKIRKLPKPPVPPCKSKPPHNEEININNNKNNDETSPLYQKTSEYIRELSIKASPPIPPQKKTPPSIPPKPAKPPVKSKPTKAVKPFPKSSTETKTSFEKEETIEYELNPPLQGFWEGDGKSAEKMLMLKEPGTFLIRLSKNAFAHPLTLMVKWEYGMKKYQIFKTNQQYHLEKTNKKGEIFDSVDELLEFYKEHQILSKEGTIFLTQPYNA